jgi:hypothetical protein
MKLLPSNIQLNDVLDADWHGALAGDPPERARWEIVDGGEWDWRDDGVRVKSAGPEWLAFAWRGWDSSAARELKNFVIEVTISGKAEAAGLSFGGFKDFLTRIDSQTGARHLQLDVDVDAGCWAFRVDGQLMQRCWWDSAICSVEDILNGVLRLKVRKVEEVLFQNLTLRALEASCNLSVIVTCYRFLQRLRVSLRNWCHQDLPSGAYEILVVNPQSPDGTHEHVAAVARSYPDVRVREIAVGSHLVKNKGSMINHAFGMSRGEWIWLTDADCLFSPNCASKVLQQIQGRPNALFYGERRFLTAKQTDAVLSGRVDALREFDDLVRAPLSREPEIYPWGYTQIVHRSTLERVRYNQEFNHFAHSDGMFANECKRHQILPLQLEGLFCLHLDHPFAWYGTDTFL